MVCDWVGKRFDIPVDGKTATVVGVQANTSDCPMVSTKQLQALEEFEDITVCLLGCLVTEPVDLPCSPEMQAILNQFSTLFGEPKGLPPKRAFDHAIPLLPGAQPVSAYWYNTYKHESLGLSPFEVFYGHPPRHFGIDPREDCATPDLQEWLSERAQMPQQQTHQHLLHARQHMKVQADKNRIEREFLVCDWVYLCFQPYIQKSIATQANPKLAFKYSRPVQILRRISPVAYEVATASISFGAPGFSCVPVEICSGTTTGACGFSPGQAVYSRSYPEASSSSTRFAFHLTNPG